MTDIAERIVTPRWPAAFPSAMATPMIGREREAVALEGMLDAGAARLITLVGPGGVGKTRLVRHVARSMADVFDGRVVWVDLDPLDEPDLLLPEMAAFMGIGESQGSDVLDRLAEALAEGRSLVVFDPVDRVASGVAALPELLRRAPLLTVLATGRAPIGVREETVVAIEPLVLPDPGAAPEAIASTPAVELFVDRLERVRPDLEPTGSTLTAIADVVRALDGLPLAIELAAAACRVIDPHQLLDRLAESISALEAADPASPSRHNTLRATMDRSAELLPEPVARLRRRLAVIAAPFHLDTAEAVLAGGERRGLAPLGVDVQDGLKALVDASLLRRVGPRDQPRYSMLRTIRADGLERLEASGEALAMRWAHAFHCLSVAESAEADLPTDRETAALDRLEAMHDDLRAALDWAGDRGDGRFAVRLAGALAEFWRARGHHTEGRIRLQAALSIGGEASPEHRRKALAGAGLLTSYQGEYALARSLLEEALELARAEGDQEATAATLNFLGTNAYGAGQLDRAEAFIAEGLAIRREIGDVGRIAVSLNAMGGIHHFRGHLDRAREVFEESLALKVRLGNEGAIAIALTNLGLVERDAMQPDRAAALFQEAVAVWERTGDRQRWAVGKHNAALVALDRGELDVARDDLLASLAVARELNDRAEIGYALTDLARVECARGETERARQYAHDALRTASSIGVRLVLLLALEATVALAASTDRPLLAARLWGAASADRDRTGFVLMPADEELLTRACAECRTSLGEAAWTAAYAEGRRLPLEAAVEEANAATAADTDGTPGRESDESGQVAG